jgi:hypothetical protein
MLCLLKAKKCPTRYYGTTICSSRGGEFKIPFMSDNIGGFKVGNAVYRLSWPLYRRCQQPLLVSHQLKY